MYYCELENIKIYHKHLEICENQFLYLFILNILLNKRKAYFKVKKSQYNKIKDTL